LALVLGPLVAAANGSVSAMGGALSAHLLLAAYATALVTSGAWFAGFHCPYCARPFHWTWIVANPLSRVCLHCGFAKWRDPHAARELRRR
jgi:hypothetical protein